MTIFVGFLRIFVSMTKGHLDFWKNMIIFVVETKN